MRGGAIFLGRPREKGEGDKNPTHPLSRSNNYSTSLEYQEREA